MMLCPLYPPKRTCAVQLRMSALGQKQTFRHSFDQLVGALLELEGYVEAERLRRLKIYDQLEFRWQLHWQPRRPQVNWWRWRRPHR
jgi:heme-degrading monooxygenase HmoA